MTQPLTELLDDPKQLSGVLRDYESRVQNADYSEVLEAGQGRLAEQHAEMFAGQYDSNLVSWPELAPSTIQRKEHSRILFESGELMASLTGVGAPGNISSVMPRGILFGTDVEYAIYHQDGTSRMPARPPVGVSAETLDAIVNNVADVAVKSMTLN